MHMFSNVVYIKISNMRKLFLLVIAVFSFLNSCQPSLNRNSIEINYDSIRVVLEGIYDRDQNIRKFLFDSVENGTPGFQEGLSEMIRIDSENQEEINSILQKYGWIQKSKIGEKASESFFYVIQHSPAEIIEKYYPQLESLAIINEASRIHSAMMKDRLLMMKGRKQIYGTQVSTLLYANGVLAIWPIENPEIVDSLRKEIGFDQTVNENAQRLGAIYNPLEKLPQKTIK